MEESEIRNLWKRYDKKLETLLSYNRWMVEEITKTKARKALAGAKPVKYLGIVLGIPWILLLNGLVVIGYLSGNPFFALSFGMISLFTTIALGTYIYHLVLIRQINISESVIDVQKKLAKIQTSGINMTRIVFLQLPFWTTWYLRAELLQEGEALYWATNIAITGIFLYAALWLFANISLENMDRKWMKLLFSDAEWSSVVQAMDILNQIDEFEKHNS